MYNILHKIIKIKLTKIPPRYNIHKNLLTPLPRLLTKHKQIITPKSGPPNRKILQQYNQYLRIRSNDQNMFNRFYYGNATRSTR